MSKRTQPQRERSIHPARKGALSVALWAFGLAASLFLIGMWGRTVSVDSATVEESARTIVDADVAAGRINAWFEDGLATASATDSETVHAVAEDIQATPEYQAAVQAIIAQFIDGLFAVDGTDPVIDLGDTLTPLVPVVVAEFEQRDIPVDTAKVEGVLDAAKAVELDAGQAASVAAVVEDARVFLTQVVLVALAMLLLTGGLAVYLSEERFAMVRTLSTRVVMSALSYAVVFRLASWALDPTRGRSPVAGGGSVLLGSNGQVFTSLAAVAGVIAAGGALFAWRRRRHLEVVAASRDDSDDDTRELVVV
jgi:hypothetical protein